MNTRMLWYLGWAIYSANGLAAPMVWLEGFIEPVSVPVNAQANYVVRFGHAIDLHEPKIELEPIRLAETVSLGPAIKSEIARSGIRYRVHEQKFAILPFASGTIVVRARVDPDGRPNKRTYDGRGISFPLIKQVTLDVTPASENAAWLPARDVRMTFDNTAPPPLRIGNVWTRELRIEAVGVAGSVIPAPEFSPSNAWVLQFDPPVFGYRTEGAQVIGYRHQKIHAQTLASGTVQYPSVASSWWSVKDQRWNRSQIAPFDVIVEGMSGEGGLSGERRARESRFGDDAEGMIRALLLAVFGGFAAWVFWRNDGLGLANFLRRIYRRRSAWQRLSKGVRNNDLAQALRALRDWASEYGWSSKDVHAMSLTDRRDAKPAVAVLVATLRDLEAAHYGQRDPDWRGTQALVSLARVTLWGWRFPQKH